MVLALDGLFIVRSLFLSCVVEYISVSILLRLILIRLLPISFLCPIKICFDKRPAQNLRLFVSENVPPRPFVLASVVSLFSLFALYCARHSEFVMHLFFVEHFCLLLIFRCILMDTGWPSDIFHDIHETSSSTFAVCAFHYIVLR